jgi:hypothetical protein
MDPRLLVTRDMAETGRRFLLQLATTDAAPLGAMWARRSDRDDQAHLFVVTPLVETKGPIAAYTIAGEIKRELNAAINDPFAEIGESDIKLLGPSDRLAKGLMEWYQQSMTDQPSFRSASYLGDVHLDGAYIYPAKMFAAPAAPSA